MSLPDRIVPRAPYRRAIRNDPALIAFAFDWLVALAAAESEGTAPAFIQRGGVASMEWDGTRITYRVRLDEDGHVRAVELWKIERVG